MVGNDLDAILVVGVLPTTIAIAKVRILIHRHVMDNALYFDCSPTSATRLRYVMNLRSG